MFAKVKKNRFYTLPKELIIYIYKFDGTYKILYNKCLNEMRKKFQINRINDRILVENNVYKVYCSQIHSRANIYGYGCNFSQYILGRIRQFGDQIPDKRLKHHKLIKLN